MGDRRGGKAAQLLEELGHTVEEASPDGLDHPAYGDALGTHYRAFCRWIIGYWCRKLSREPADGEIEPQTRAYWESAKRVSADEYLITAGLIYRVIDEWEEQGLGRSTIKNSVAALVLVLNEAKRDEPASRSRPGGRIWSVAA
ncbi:hypothetical protein [Jiangella gansuensis]|uniref:hypothetical protein n=1 Tax=Jiangella gansuensis TaxID=281473 RepID=UPI00047E8601|nr:hypothetical protein [Jiangella gansuensis]